MISPDFFNLIRLILPHLDRQRGMYNMKEAMLANLYGDVFGLPKAEIDKMKHFKDPTKFKDIRAVSRI